MVCINHNLCNAFADHFHQNLVEVSQKQFHTLVVYWFPTNWKHWFAFLNLIFSGKNSQFKLFSISYIFACLAEESIVYQVLETLSKLFIFITRFLTADTLPELHKHVLVAMRSVGTSKLHELLRIRFNAIFQFIQSRMREWTFKTNSEDP